MFGPGFRRILVVIKQTAYEASLNLYDPFRICPHESCFCDRIFLFLFMVVSVRLPKTRADDEASSCSLFELLALIGVAIRSVG